MSTSEIHDPATGLWCVSAPTKDGKYTYYRALSIYATCAHLQKPQYFVSDSSCSERMRSWYLKGEHKRHSEMTPR